MRKSLLFLTAVIFSMLSTSGLHAAGCEGIQTYQTYAQFNLNRNGSNTIALPITAAYGTELNEINIVPTLSVEKTGITLGTSTASLNVTATLQQWTGSSWVTLASDTKSATQKVEYIGRNGAYADIAIRFKFNNLGSNSAKTFQVLLSSTSSLGQKVEARYYSLSARADYKACVTTTPVPFTGACAWSYRSQSFGLGGLSTNGNNTFEGKVITGLPASLNTIRVRAAMNASKTGPTVSKGYAIVTAVAELQALINNQWKTLETKPDSASATLEWLGSNPRSATLYLSWDFGAYSITNSKHLRVKISSQTGTTNKVRIDSYNLTGFSVEYFDCIPATSTPTRTVTRTRTATPTPTASPSRTPSCGNGDVYESVAVLALDGQANCGINFNPPIASTTVNAVLPAGRYRVSLVPNVCTTYNGAGNLVGAGFRWGTLINGSYTFLGTGFQTPATPNNSSCTGVWNGGGIVFGGSNLTGIVQLEQPGQLWFLIGDGNCTDNSGGIQVRVERMVLDCASPTPTLSSTGTATETATPSDTATATPSATESATPSFSETTSDTVSPSPSVTPSRTPFCDSSNDVRETVAELDMDGRVLCGANFDPPVPSTIATAVLPAGTYRVSLVPGVCTTYNGAGTLVGAGFRWGTLINGAYSFQGTGFQSPTSPANGSCTNLWASGGMIYGGANLSGEIELTQPGALWFLIGDSNCFDNSGGIRVRIERVVLRCSTPTQTSSSTPSATETETPSSTETWSVTESPTRTVTDTATQTVTETATPSVTETETPSATETATPSATETETPSATETATSSATETETPSATETATPSATESATPSTTGTATPSATESATPSATETATPSFSASPSNTASPSSSSTPSASPTGTASPSSTRTPFCCPIPVHQSAHSSLLGAPIDAAIDPQGRVWALYPGDLVRRLNADGSVAESYTRAGARSIRFDALGRFYSLHSDGSVQRRPNAAAAGFSDAQGVAFSVDYYTGFAVLPNGQTYVSDRLNNRVFQISQDFSNLSMINGISSPSTLSYDAQGQVFAASFGRLYRIWPGPIALVFDRTLSGLNAAGDANGAVIVVPNGGAQVQLYSQGGTLICSRSSAGDSFIVPQGDHYLSLATANDANRTVTLGAYLLCDPAFSPTVSPSVTSTRTRTEDLTITRTHSGTPTLSRTPTPTPTPACNQCAASNVAYTFGGGLLSASFGSGAPLVWQGPPAAPSFAPVLASGTPFSFMGISGFRIGGRLDVGASGAQAYNSTGFWLQAFTGPGAANGDRVVYDWAHGRRRVRIELLDGGNGQLRASYSSPSGTRTWLSPVGAVVGGNVSDRSQTNTALLAGMSRLHVTVRDCILGITLNGNTAPVAPQYSLPDFGEDPGLPVASYLVLGNDVGGGNGFDGVITGVQVQGCSVPPTSTVTVTLTQSQTHTISPTFSASPTVTVSSTVSPTYTPDVCPACAQSQGLYSFNAATLDPQSPSTLAPLQWSPASPSYAGPSGQKLLTGFYANNGRLNLGASGMDLQAFSVQFFFAQFLGLNSASQVLLDWAEGGRWLQVLAYSQNHVDHGRIVVRYSGEGGIKTAGSATGLYGALPQGMVSGLGNLAAMPGSVAVQLSVRDCGWRLAILPLQPGAQARVLAADDLQSDGTAGAKLYLGNAELGGQGLHGAIDQVHILGCAAPSPTPSATATPTPSPVLPPPQLCEGSPLNGMASRLLDLAKDPSSSRIAAASYNSSVLAFFHSATGAFLNLSGTPGAGATAGTLHNPHVLAFDSLGGVYVVDNSAGAYAQLQYFDPAGQGAYLVGPGQRSMYDLAVDSADRLYSLGQDSANPQNISRVRCERRLGGTLLPLWTLESLVPSSAPGQFDGVSALAVDEANGRLLVADNNRVQAFALVDGAYLGTVLGPDPSLGYIRALAMGPGGRLAVTVDNGFGIRIYDSALNLLSQTPVAAAGQWWNAVSSMIFDDAGKLWVLGQSSSQVRVFGGCGSPLQSARLEDQGPKDLVLPTQADLLIAPNPFAGKGVMQVSLPQAAQARVLVMDLHGTVLHAQDLGALGAGTHRAPLALDGLASGIYLAQLQIHRGEGWALGDSFKLAIVR